jgi:hypothetical protein
VVVLDLAGFQLAGQAVEAGDHGFEERAHLVVMLLCLPFGWRLCQSSRGCHERLGGGFEPSSDTSKCVFHRYFVFQTPKALIHNPVG